MRAAAGAISRARERARARLEIAFDDLAESVEKAADGLELGEIQGLQVSVPTNLTHAWPRARSAAGEARRDARGGGRDQPSAGEGARAP